MKLLFIVFIFMSGVMSQAETLSPQDKRNANGRIINLPQVVLEEGELSEDFEGYVVAYNGFSSLVNVEPLSAESFEEAFVEAQDKGDYVSGEFVLLYVKMSENYATDQFDGNGCIVSDSSSSEYLGRVYSSLMTFYSTIPGATMEIRMAGRRDPVSKGFFGGVKSENEIKQCRKL